MACAGLQIHCSQWLTQTINFPEVMVYKGYELQKLLVFQATVNQDASVIHAHAHIVSPASQLFARES